MSSHSISIDEAKRLMVGGYGQQLREAISRYIAPLYWWQTIDGRAHICANGTAFFLDTGTRTLAVTANHVYEHYLRCRGCARVNCQLLNLDFDPHARLIDRSAELDIATFSITPEDVQRVGANKVPLTVWPPMVPQTGKGIMFAGFPGHERREIDVRKIEFGNFTSFATAHEVGLRHVSSQVEREYLVDTPDSPAPDPGYDLGGISGAPLLTLVERNSFVWWALGGVIYEAHADWEIVLATRADVIGSDGRLSRQ